ncbi:hypothetical protein [Pseudomonas nitroreducens]|uniref:hypothetical protein n=1 Tax=Pseudomonas nitroreducens TaxID=46680 RepID=UPI002D804943|nr:hypothetical protein [Pseudomonas nitroreducens]
MKQNLHPWSNVLLCADDYWHGMTPEPAHIERVQSSARDLQFTITNGLSALNALLHNHDDALRDEEAMDLLRLLASLGDVLLSLRLFEEGTAEIRERLSKEKLA